MRPSERLANLNFGTLRETNSDKKVTLRETFSQTVIRFNRAIPPETEYFIFIHYYYIYNFFYSWKKLGLIKGIREFL